MFLQIEQKNDFSSQERVQKLSKKVSIFVEYQQNMFKIFLHQKRPTDAILKKLLDENCREHGAAGLISESVIEYHGENYMQERRYFNAIRGTKSEFPWYSAFSGGIDLKAASTGIAIFCHIFLNILEKLFIL